MVVTSDFLFIIPDFSGGYELEKNRYFSNTGSQHNVVAGANFSEAGL